MRNNTDSNQQTTMTSPAESVEDGGGDGGGGEGGGVSTTTQTRVMVDSNATSTTTVTDTPDETTTKTSTSKFTKTTKVKTIKIVKKKNSLVANAINEINSMTAASEQQPVVRKFVIKKSESPKKLPGVVKKVEVDGVEAAKTDSKTVENEKPLETAKENETNDVDASTDAKDFKDMNDLAQTKKHDEVVPTANAIASKESVNDTPNSGSLGKTSSTPEVNSCTKEKLSSEVAKIASDSKIIVKRVTLSSAGERFKTPGMTETPKPKFLIKKKAVPKTNDQISSDKDASSSKVVNSESVVSTSATCAATSVDSSVTSVANTPAASAVPESAEPVEPAAEETMADIVEDSGKPTSLNEEVSPSAVTSCEGMTAKKTKSSSSLSTRPKKFTDVPNISKTQSTDAVTMGKLKLGPVNVRRKVKSADDVNLEKSAKEMEKVMESKEDVSSSKSTLASVEDVTSNSGDLSEAVVVKDSSKLSESPSASNEKLSEVVSGVVASCDLDDQYDDNAGNSSCEGATGITVSETSKTSDTDSQIDSELSNVSVFVIVRDMSGLTVNVNKITIVTPATSTCGELMQEVGRRFKYEPDSFSLVLQCSDGSQVEIEKMEAERTLADARFQVEGTPRNNLILCDLNGHLPHKTDEDDLSLGASASPTANATERKWFDRSSSHYDNTPEYSYSSALIKHDTGYVGLVNQAMTCYLNSLLQTLYMTPEFRNALYQWEFKGSEDEACKNIPCQLQRLFLLLQTTNKSAVETTNLTKSFGWDSSEAWQQHDIQELCRVMFDALEQCFKNTHQSNLINDLYEGKMSDYVKCLECGNEGARVDTYLDIPLPIRPFGSSSAYKSV
ncbi:Ubiquitin carboxyl-terminal hydrolase 47, partial [Halocaridina rubra]